MSTLGPDVQCQAVGGVGGVATETEDQELYLLCLCEQPSLNGNPKVGRKTFLGFLVGIVLHLGSTVAAPVIINWSMYIINNNLPC